MSLHPLSFCHNSFSHFCAEVKVLIGVQLLKQKASKCFSWSRFRLRLEFKRIINEKNMDFSSLYLTPHYLLSVNENFASTIQEKFTHKWLNFESFQAGMMTLSKISKWKDSSPIINRVNSTESGLEIFVFCLQTLFLSVHFQRDRLRRFQETKLSKIDKQHIGETSENHYISCDSCSFRNKSTVLKYVILSSYFEFFCQLAYRPLPRQCYICWTCIQKGNRNRNE